MKHNKILSAYAQNISTWELYYVFFILMTSFCQALAFAKRLEVSIHISQTDRSHRIQPYQFSSFKDGYCKHLATDT